MFCDYFLSAKCSLVSLRTVGAIRNTAIKLGTTIKPLNVSEMPQIRSRLIVAPTIEISAYAT